MQLTLYSLLGCLLLRDVHTLFVKSVGSDSAGRIDARARNFILESRAGAHNETKQPIRVACVGSSLTHGFVTSGDSYPTVLQKLLGPDYAVTNLGVVATVVQKRSLVKQPNSYWDTEAKAKLANSTWDIVVITFGTSDALDPPYWNHEFCDRDEALGNCSFWSDYNDLIGLVRTLGSPEVYLTIPPAVTKQGVYTINQTIVNSVLPQLIPKIATTNEISEDHVIDLFAGLGGYEASFLPEDGCKSASNMTLCKYFFDGVFCDNVHPVAAGKYQMASLVAESISKNAKVNTTT